MKRQKLHRQLAAILVLFCVATVRHAGAEPATSEGRVRNPGAPPAATASSKSNLGLPEWGYFSILLLRDTSVQAELKLTTAQVEALPSMIGDADIAIWSSRNYPLQERAERMSGPLREFRERVRQGLSAGQRTRLDQLVLQARGSSSLIAPDIAGRLKLTEKQTEEVEQTLKQTTTALDRLEKEPASRTDSELQTERTKLRKKEYEQILAALSTRQRSEVKVMVGASFDLGAIKQCYTRAPDFRPAQAWLNSEPLDLKQLRGKVIVIHFWAFGCINCVHNLPCYQRWREAFSPDKVVIVGIHTPETERARDVAALTAKIREHTIAYPVLVDAKGENWQAWDNRMWPTVYVVDKQGFVRTWWAGELGWEGARGEEIVRHRIEELLAEK